MISIYYKLYDHHRHNIFIKYVVVTIFLFSTTGCVEESVKIIIVPARTGGGGGCLIFIIFLIFIIDTIFSGISKHNTKQKLTPSISVTKAVVAAGIDKNKVPYGISSNFSSSNKRPIYYVTYNGATPEQTVFIFKWYKDGVLITEDRFFAKFANGNVWNQPKFDFQPGQYEVQLYSNDKRISISAFNLNEFEKKHNLLSEINQPPDPVCRSIEVVINGKNDTLTTCRINGKWEVQK